MLIKSLSLLLLLLLCLSKVETKERDSREDIREGVKGGVKGGVREGVKGGVKEGVKDDVKEGIRYGYEGGREKRNINDQYMHLVESQDADDSTQEDDSSLSDVLQSIEEMMKLNDDGGGGGGGGSDGGDGGDRDRGVSGGKEDSGGDVDKEDEDIDDIVKILLKAVKKRKIASMQTEEETKKTKAKKKKKEERIIEEIKGIKEDKEKTDKISTRVEDSPCGVNQPLVVTNPSGAIMSPGFFSGKYKDSLKCSWKFVAPVAKVVKVKFQVMDIEQSNECTYDSVQVWDVKASKGLRIAKYCGRTLPMELLQSTGRYMFVYFLSDESNGVGRFSFQWDFIDPMPPEPADISCGLPSIKPSLKPRIVNGVPAVPHSWPWQISIRKVVGGRHYHICGGSIIAESVILTAAHCFFDKYHKRIPDSSIRVVAGDHDQSSRRDGPTQTPKIESIKIHKYYNSFSSSSPYDIAAVFLKTPLVLNKHVGSICLPRDDPRIDDVCFSTGWGETEGTGDETILNQVRLPIVSQAICRQPNHYGSQIVDTVLCAGYEEGGKDACQGDSGGPFVCFNRLNGRWYLEGITSWGAGCGVARKPGVYTRVNSYLSWIYKMTEVVS